MNRNKLLGKMAEAGYTQKMLAASLNRSENSISEKINGKRSFTTDEILAICNVLQINDDREKVQIFLT